MRGRDADSTTTTADASRVRAVVSYFRDRSRYPRSGKPDAQGDIYWANIAANAATFRHVAGPTARFLVCAGDTPPPGPAEVLRDAGAEIRQVPFASQPPDDFYTRYVGSLYLFDVMRALVDDVADDEVLLFIDPDIVWVRDLDPLVAEVQRGGVVAYDLRVAADLPMCDLTREQQGEIMAAIDGGEVAVPTHFGGEFYGMLGEELAPLLADLDPVWRGTVARYERGEAHYHVEEHVVNAVLHRRGEHVGRANDHLHRIITLPPPFGTRERADAPLVAWHLPLEKDRGFLRLARSLARGGTMPPPGPAYQRWLGRRMGIEPVGVRAAADTARRVKWAVTGRARRGTRFHGL